MISTDFVEKRVRMIFFLDSVVRVYWVFVFKLRSSYVFVSICNQFIAQRPCVACSSVGGF